MQREVAVATVILQETGAPVYTDYLDEYRDKLQPHRPVAPLAAPIVDAPGKGTSRTQQSMQVAEEINQQLPTIVHSREGADEVVKQNYLDVPTLFHQSFTIAWPVAALLVVCFLTLLTMAIVR